MNMCFNDMHRFCGARSWRFRNRSACVSHFEMQSSWWHQRPSAIRSAGIRRRPSHHPQSARSKLGLWFAGIHISRIRCTHSVILKCTVFLSEFISTSSVNFSYRCSTWIQETIVKLQEEHLRSGSAKRAIGLDLYTGEPIVAADQGIYDNLLVKRQIINSAYG